MKTSKKTSKNKITSKEVKQTLPKTYTPEGEHPEDRIFKDKTFINELTSVQTLYYEKLVKALGLNEKGETFLFDYIYNDDSNLSFEEYLDKYSLAYENCTKK